MRGLLLVCALVLSACASTRPVLIDYLPSGAPDFELSDTPFIAQAQYQCGPAALAMLLQAGGLQTTAEELTPRVYIPKLEGSLQAEMVAAARDFGRVPYRIAPDLKALLAELRSGRPVLVLQNLGWNIYPIWHYALVVGYLPNQDKLILRSGTTRRKLKSTEDFIDDWQRAQAWGLIALLPGSLPADSSPVRYIRAATGLELAGKLASAELAYRSATIQWPEEPAAWLGLGNVQYALDDFTAAQRSYQQALKRAPDEPVLRNNLAQVLARRGCKKAASKQISIALKTAPPNLRAAMLDTLQQIDALPETQTRCE